MKSITLLHPFSARAIGLHEEDLFFSHSKPHEKALKQLKEDGYKVAIEYFTGSIFPFRRNVNGIEKNFWPITRPLIKKRHGWRKQYSLWHYLTYYFNTPDVTIINMSGHGSRYCFKLAKLLKRKGKNYIAMIGGIHMSTDTAAMEYYNNSHHIIVHTEVQKDYLLGLESFKNISIRVMPLGVDTILFKALAKSGPTKELLFVGRISRLKQIELCLETLAYLKEHELTNVNLTIVGPISDPQYFQELKDLVGKLQIKEEVQFVGAVAQVDLVPYYQKADLLVLPSEHESFGMVMVEAMACGTPVAALKGSGGPDEVVEDGVNGILCTRNDYKDRILEYISIPELQTQMCENSRKMAEDKWSISVTVDSLRSSIHDVFS